MKRRMPSATKDKAKAKANAIKDGRKVLWLDREGKWHSSTDRANTPGWALETEDVKA